MAKDADQEIIGLLNKTIELLEKCLKELQTGERIDGRIKEAQLLKLDMENKAASYALRQLNYL